MKPKLSSISIMFTIIMLLALLVGLPSIAQPVLAAPYIVTNTGNSGSGSLRQAIEDAKINPGPDVITFDPAINGAAIELTGGADEDANASGDLDILDSDDLTIQGNGALYTIIDGGGNDRVFHICPGGGCDNTVNLTGMTVRNGVISAYAGGGGIYNQGGNMSLESTTVSLSTAIWGGGIYNQQGTMVLDGCTLSTNTAEHGGGIHSNGTLTITNSTIGGVGAGNTVTGVGGGIFAAGTVLVTGSTISDNTATDGGGIFNYEEARLTVTNSTIGGAGGSNTATDRGGGIFNEWSGYATLDGSTVSANTAPDGGGIYNQATLNVQNGSTIGGAGVGNDATGNGGGIFNQTGTITVTGSAVSANTATKYGGGIYNAIGGTAIVDGSTVSANTASWGGGITNEGDLNVQSGSTIGRSGAGNTGATYGGGIYNKAGTTTLDNSAISANTAASGGGIYNSSTLIVQNGSIIGGAEAANTATYGGGVYNHIGITTVDGSTISYNNTTHDGGGVSNHATLNIKNGSAISTNTTNTFGGGIYNSNGTTTVDGSAIIANTAARGGGVSNHATLYIKNGSIIGGTGTGNTANSKGGGINNYNGTATVDDSTISANTAADGGGIYNGKGKVTVTDCRILNNIASTNGGGVYNGEDVAGAVDVSLSCIVGNSDISFVNTETTVQIATDNWWGAVAGPNTQGADTFSGKMDTSGFLTAPILGCTPDLQVNKANDTGGETKAGTLFHWTLTVSNSGLTNVTFSNGQRILVDDLPSGPNYGTPTAADMVNITNGANIDCSIDSDSLSCEAGGGGVIVGADGSFAVSFSVTSNDVGTLTNPTGICRVDPDGNVGEGDEADNNCPTDIVEVLIGNIYLPLVMR